MESIHAPLAADARRHATDDAAARRWEDTGKLLLRLALGVLVLLHGLSKLIGGADAIFGMVTSAGLPAALGYGVYVGEVIAPLLVILGLWTRPAAALISLNMVFAVLLAHGAQFFTMSKTGGWALELQGMFFFTAVAVSMLGAGRYSVGGARSRWS